MAVLVTISLTGDPASYQGACSGVGCKKALRKLPEARLEAAGLVRQAEATARTHDALIRRER